ncbi:hypothetical protein TREMEDRAFT_36273 [Tremella mesenterica DSM 1558]|uniref:uncharacterized protein n=1 Tax=Tremella mesenterica (strain ATCC 24925 / CBS 8224 / DSM 1558 / NBRC 9311 / NRRL Y-6157 / RJB 2259-6 / UBC 559-6) TaxID=578456 RepID=UPI00032C82A0|nr:uncharacterized protein TREMEDRAFT_36273 [Tremella mesenterica DSM 1558]EIW65453.1 hypothetical protein TREMEDRAFT_36273 [Tremella mesenterica DSM 1558]
MVSSTSASVSSASVSSSAVSSSSSSVSVTSSVSTSSSASSTSASASSSASASATGPNPAFQTNVTFNGQTYINKGLVGFGAISGDALDSAGDSIGGIGSAIALEWSQRNGDSYEGVMMVQPDRGHNTVGTIDYIGRHHFIYFTLNPYYSSTKLDYQSAKSTFQLSYQSSVFYKESDGNPTTGLDALGVRNSTIPLPIASSTYDHISVDNEGLIINSDGTTWVSDEYGPYIYKYSSDGHILTTIEPPRAVVPYLNGQIYFGAGDEDPTPDTGRKPNQGFEGITASPDGSTLYVLLQSGCMQDVDLNGEGRFTRMFIYDVTSSVPILLHAYVLELPVTNGKAKALAQSEIHYLSPTTFMVLSRDGKGNGDTDNDSKHKDFLLYSTDGATDIVDMDYTTGVKPVSPNGILDDGLVAMQPTEFIDLLDDTQLNRFGLCNNCDFSVNLINSKWESIALASVEDPDYPNDYFLFSWSDNDFMSLNGHDVTGDFSDPYCVEHGYSLDNQALVWRVTLP